MDMNLALVLMSLGMSHIMLGCWFFRRALIPHLIKLAYLGDENCLHVLAIYHAHWLTRCSLVVSFCLLWPIPMVHAAILSMRTRTT